MCAYLILINYFSFMNLNFDFRRTAFTLGKFFVPQKSILEAFCETLQIRQFFAYDRAKYMRTNLENVSFIHIYTF